MKIDDIRNYWKNRHVFWWRQLPFCIFHPIHARIEKFHRCVGRFFRLHTHALLLLLFLFYFLFMLFSFSMPKWKPKIFSKNYSVKYSENILKIKNFFSVTKHNLRFRSSSRFQWGKYSFEISAHLWPFAATACANVCISLAFIFRALALILPTNSTKKEVLTSIFDIMKKFTK